MWWTNREFRYGTRQFESERLIPAPDEIGLMGNSARRDGPRLLIIDCCEHVVEALQTALETDRPSVVTSHNVDELKGGDSPDLIVVGTPPPPFRRTFLSRLRRFFPSAPILILRKENKNARSEEEVLRGDFLLSDRRSRADLSIVRSVREALPLAPCEHLQSGENFELVREVTRVLADNYSDSELDLEQVADELSVSPARLSRILNREVNISFRQMLRQIRIEEAKRLIATGKLSIKEVAARVGFADSHYFSRIFKEVTGTPPTEFTLDPQEFILN